MAWNKTFKIALVEEDIEKIETLLQELPQFETTQEMEEAAYLMQEAHRLLSKNRDELAKKLLTIQKQKAFVGTTHRSSFDKSL